MYNKSLEKIDKFLFTTNNRFDLKKKDIKELKKIL